MNTRQLPRWFFILLLGLLINQWLLFAASLWLMPNWETIFGIPVDVFRLMMGVVAALITPLLGYALRVPHSRLTQTGLRVLRELRKSLFAAPVVFVILVAGSYLIGSPSTIVYNLLGLHFLLAAAVLLNAQLDPVLRWAPWALLIFGFLARFAYIFVTYIQNDEGIYLSAVDNFLTTGTVSASMFFIPPEIIIRPGWGYSVALMGIWSRIFGVNIITLRLLSYLQGAAALIFTYLAVKNLYDRRSALISTAFMSVSVLLAISTVVRNDAFTMATVALILWLYTLATHKAKMWLHVLVGFAAALSLQAHLTNVAIIVAFSGIYAVFWVQQMRSGSTPLFKHPIIYFMIGLIPGLLLFLYFNIFILPYPETFLPSVFAAMPSNVNPVWGRFETYAQRLVVYWQVAPVELLLVLLTLGFTLWRRSRIDTRWLWLLLFTQVGYFLAAPFQSIRYTLYGLPIFLAASGSIFTSKSTNTSQNVPGWRNWAFLFLSVLMAGKLFARVEYERLAQNDFSNMHADTLHYVRANISPDSGIIAPSLWYALLPEYKTFVMADTNDLRLGPILTRTDPEAFWLNVLLDTRPQARIDRSVDFYQVEVFSSYMEARHAAPVTPLLSVVDDGLTIFRDQTDSQYPLDLVAYSQIDSAGHIDTLWVTWQSIDANLDIAISVQTPDGENVAASQQIISSEWDAYEFHSLTLEIPGDIHSANLISLSYGHPTCSSNCIFSLDELE